MEHDQSTLPEVDQGVTNVEKGKATNELTKESTSPYSDRSTTVQRRRSDFVRSNVKQQLGGPTTTTDNTDHIRRRESIVRRHEQSLSTRRSFTGSNLHIPSRRISFPSLSTKPSPREYLALDKSNNKNIEQELPKDESTPLIETPTLLPSQNLAAIRSSYSLSSASQSRSFGTSMQEQHQQQTPRFKRSHWASIKQHVHKGTFLVSEFLSHEGGLWDTDVGASATTEGPYSLSSSVRTIEERRRQAIENFQKGSTFSPQHCLLAIFLYLIVAVFMFCFVLEPQWTVIDSCYFAVSTFTTLGYGDLSPTSTVSVIFTTIYALAGVACLGLALGILGSQLLETKEDHRFHEHLTAEYEALTMFDHDDNSTDDYYDSDDDHEYFEPDLDDEEIGEDKERHPSRSIISSDKSPHGGISGKTDKTVSFCKSIENEKFHTEDSTLLGGKSPSVPSATLIDSRTTYGVGKVRFVVLLSIAMIFAILIGYQSGWGFWSTFYYAVTTSATIGKNQLLAPRRLTETVRLCFFPSDTQTWLLSPPNTFQGYGDLTPSTQLERFLAIIFIPLACAVMGHSLAWFAKWIVEKQGEKFRKNTFDSHNQLTLDDLRVMDITGGR
jgi:hypothetical protein